MGEKNLGYVLLCAGLFFMILAVAVIVLTLMNKISPITVFNIPAPTINTSSFMPAIPGLPKSEGADISVLPTDAFNKILNIGAEFMLMYFILSFGFKLSDLGVKMLRPIKITGVQDKT